MGRQGHLFRLTFLSYESILNNNKEGRIMKTKNIKVRSALARAVRDPKGPFVQRSVPDKTKFKRNVKHKGKAYEAE